MPQTTAEIIADIDATVARLEAYRLELEARPVAHGYLEPGPSDNDEPGVGFRLPTRPALTRHTPRPPASGTAFSIAGSELLEPKTSLYRPLFNPQPDWLAHVLTVTGSETVLALFRAAAAGTGRLSWGPDVTSCEDMSRIFPVGDARTAALIGQIVQSQTVLLGREAGSSIRLGQGRTGSQFRFSRSKVFARMIMRRMIAVMATFLAFPALMSCSYLRLKSALKRMATSAGM